MSLYEGYKDDILNTEKNSMRKYRMINNSDGTVSFEDVTSYTQVGDLFGAADVNAITSQVNKLSDKKNISSYSGTLTYFDKSELRGFIKVDGAFESGKCVVQLSRNSSVILDNKVSLIASDLSVTGSQVIVSAYSNGGLFESGDTLDVNVLCVI